MLKLVDFVADKDLGYAELKAETWNAMHLLLGEVWQRYSAQAHTKVDKVLALMEPKIDFFSKNTQNKA